MNINNAFPSKWLKSGDIGEDDLTLTIASVELETVGQGDDAEQKPVVYFQETGKGLVLNKTNADAISKMHGPETDGWPGKRIALFATEVDFGGKQTLALRVRLKAPKTATTNGNGHAPAAAVDPKLAWNEFVKSASVSKADVVKGLGVEKVSEWLAAVPGRTIDQAIEAVTAVLQPF